MMIRTFIAIKLPTEVKQVARQIQNQLGESIEGIKWVKHENLHLSVKFLGNVEENRINDIATAVKNAVKESSVMNLKTGHLGVFPNEKSPRILWLGLEGDVPDFIRMSKNCESELAKLGYEIDARENKPHITIGRIRSTKKQKGVINILKDIPIESILFRVDALKLMRSELNRNGAVYTNLQSVKLDK